MIDSSDQNQDVISQNRVKYYKRDSLTLPSPRDASGGGFLNSPSPALWGGGGGERRHCYLNDVIVLSIFYYQIDQSPDPLLSIISGSLLNPLNFLAGLGVAWLSLLFFLSFTLMLGGIFNNRGLVIGISLGLLLLQQYLLSLIPFLHYVLPWTLSAPLQTTADALLPSLLLGLPVASFVPQLIIIGVEIVVFVLVTIWRFNGEEF